jgi:hypothetical protein
VEAAFEAATDGALTVGNGVSSYTARATLVTMREFTNAVTGLTETLQTWAITGVGTRPGLGAAEVEISATIEQPLVPIFSYAAFGTGNGCDILNFAGGGNTSSYDSSLGATPQTLDLTGGNVGTNGNLAVLGGTTTINGTLSTPRAGVGNCTNNNVTAVTISGNGSVTEGLVELPQEVDYEDPGAIVPTPPTTNISWNGSSTCVAYVLLGCVGNGNGVTLTPATPTTEITLGNISVTGGANLVLNAGIYEVNSISLTGNSTLTIASGPVVIRVQGDGQATPINLTGGAIANSTYVSSNLQFVYGGTGNVTLNGGTTSSALVYAPNADITLNGNADFYGSIIGETVTVSGGARLVYDRALGSTIFKPGNISLTTFTWESF